MDSASGFVYYDASGVLLCDKKTVDVHYLGNNLVNSASHDPFGKYCDYFLRDNYVLFPEYDFDGMISFVANRYAWGMNVCVGFFDPVKNIIYCGKSYNFDYPPGIALRKINKSNNYPECQIFISNEDKQRRIIYRDAVNDPVIFFDNLYPDSNWCNLGIEKDFKHLKKCIEWLRDPDQGDDQIEKFEQKIKELKELVEQCDDSLNKKDYENCIAFGNKFVSDPWNYIYVYSQGYLGTTEYVRIQYNIACAYALTGRPDDAMNRLLCIENEWYDWDHLDSDEDLKSLHSREDFKQLVTRHIKD